MTFVLSGQVKKMTAHEVLSPGFVDNIVKQDDGFRVLRNLRGQLSHLLVSVDALTHEIQIFEICDKNI
jgi:hypothetical protein